MQIRTAVQDDISALAQMWYVGWHSAHAHVVHPDLVRLRRPAEFVARMQTHLAQTCVAVVAGRIAGFFMIDGDELYQFYVATDHHGSGVAQAMMGRAEAVLPPPRAWLACSVGNDRAAAFYTKCGWVDTGAVVMEVETSEGPKPVNIWRFEKIF